MKKIANVPLTENNFKNSLLLLLLLLGIFFTEGISPDENSYRKLVHVSLQCWQFSGFYRIMVSFHICFRFL